MRLIKQLLSFTSAGLLAVSLFAASAARQKLRAL